MNSALYFLRRLIVPACLLLFIQCGSGNEHVQRARLGEVIIAVDSAPESLDPRVGTSLASYRAHQLLYNPLVNQGARGELVPDLATRWERLPSEAGSETELWRFQLRENLRFHDGTRLDAGDVVYTFSTMMRPEFISRKRGAFSDLITVSEEGKYTVVFEFSRRQTAFLSNLPAVGIIPEGHSFESGLLPVGTGPFRMTEQRGSREFIFEAFPHYHLGKPHIGTLIMKVIPDDTTRALEVMHGSVDLVINDLNVRDAEHLGSWPGRKLKKAPGLQYEYLGFNHRHPMLKVKEVRQAIAYAINRQVIIDSLLAGLARPAVSPMLPELWSIRADFTSYDYDPDKARSLLDEAGFPDPDGEGPATRFSLEMKCSSRKSSRDLAVVIRQQLRDVGIEVTVKSTEWQTFYADVVNGNFSLYALRWIGIIDPDFFGSIFHSSSIPGEERPQGKRRGSLNRGRFRNVDVDRLIEAAETELDESMRWRIFADLQHKISEELPYVDLWYRDNFAVMRDDLTGLELTLNASFGVLYKLRYLK